MRPIDADAFLKWCELNLHQNVLNTQIRKWIDAQPTVYTQKEIIPCSLNDEFYYPQYCTYINPQGEIKEHSEIEKIKVCSLTLKHDGTWNIMTSHRSSVQKFTVEDIGVLIFYTYEEAERKLEELKRERCYK